MIHMRAGAIMSQIPKNHSTMWQDPATGSCKDQGAKQGPGKAPCVWEPTERQEAMDLASIEDIVPRWREIRS